MWLFQYKEQYTVEQSGAHSGHKLGKFYSPLPALHIYLFQYETLSPPLFNQLQVRSLFLLL